MNYVPNNSYKHRIESECFTTSLRSTEYFLPSTRLERREIIDFLVLSNSSYTRKSCREELNEFCIDGINFGAVGLEVGHIGHI